MQFTQIKALPVYTAEKRYIFLFFLLHFVSFHVYMAATTGIMLREDSIHDV